MPVRTHPLKRDAFTLIELLVVVAIIALLISILLPSLSRAREQAYQVKCASNLNGIFKGVYYYTEDKRNGNGYLPQLSFQVASQWSNQYFGAIWIYQILPYVDIKRSTPGSKGGFYQCPAEEHPAYRYVQQPWDPSEIGEEELSDPVGKKAEYDNRTLAVRGQRKEWPWLEPVSYSGSCDSNQRRRWNFPGSTHADTSETPRKLDDLEKPHCWPLLTETDRDYRASGCWRYWNLRNAFVNADLPGFRRHYGGESITNNGVNWLFGDGHVQWHSAHYAATSLICCVDLGREPADNSGSGNDGRSIMDRSDWESITSYCAGK